MTHIFEWKCSYYCDRMWKYGHLKLYQEELKFKEKSKDGKSIKINISDIKEVKRRTTNLLFNAITITNARKDVFWFSSFANVYNVLSIIQHFWKDSLFSNEDGTNNSSKSQGAQRNELLEIAYDSQSTLMSAGRTLQAQGEQITAASMKMDMLHSDLRIGEQIVSDLDSWFGAWKVKTPNPVLVSGRAESPLVSQRLEYAVLVARTMQESHNTAVLVIGTKDIEIFGEKNKLLYSFPIAELSYATVHSPYDMTFERRLIGKPDIKVHIIATRLPFILKTFENVCKYKPIYEDLPTSSDDENSRDLSATKMCPGRNDYGQNVVKPALECLGDRKIKENPGAFAEPKDTRSNWSRDNQVQRQHVKPGSQQLCDSDANELASVLRNMKAMAIDIKQEQDLQNDQLDRLTESVQRADMKVREDNRIIKKML